MDSIQKKLEDIQFKNKEKQRIDKLLRNVKREKNELEIKVKCLEEELQKEVKDVKKLEGMSFQNFFHTLVGNKDHLLEKEQAEALSAKMKYEEASRSLEQIQRTVQSFERQIKGFGDLKAQYNAILKEKEEWIYSHDEGIAKELFSIAEDQGKLKAECKEITEAISAGNRVLNEVENVRQSLGSAQGWGTWDMLGGGMIATMQKHSYMEEAQHSIHRVQQLLSEYHRELADIGAHFTADIQIDSFMSFADYFFDGFFVDWAVQSQIKEAQRTVDDFIYKIKGLNNRLAVKKEQIVNRIEELEEKRKELIEGL